MAALTLSVICHGRHLPKDGSGYVHSVFARAVNLSFAGHGLMALLAPILPMSAWALRLPPLPIPFTSLVRPGDPCLLQSGILRVGETLICDCTASKLFRGDLIDAVVIDPASSTQLLGMASDENYPGLCALFSPSPEAFVSLESAILALTAEIVDDLLKALEQNNPMDELCSLTRLIGLGAGLTPSGDDFVGGFVAARFALSTLGSQDPELRALYAGLLQGLERTSSVAAMFLALAAQGSFSEFLTDLVRALGIGHSLTERRERVARLLSFGASSGADTFAGILAGIGGKEIRDRVRARVMVGKQR